MPKEFDLAGYVRASTAASGVPERVQDPDVIRDGVSLLLAMRAKPLQSSSDQTATRHRRLGPSTSAHQGGQSSR
jgi:hypothetical protein